MQETDLAGQAGPRRGVDQLRAFVLRRRQLGADVGRIEAQMMQPFAAAREEARHRATRTERFQQLDLAVTRGEERGPDALIRKLRLLEQRKPEHVPIEPIRVAQPLHRDADVMNRPDHAL